MYRIDVAVTRTGMVSLTATFKPVEIDGTMVSRAYVHNFTIYKNLALGVGDKLMVYKANKIIPQIAENRTKSGGGLSAYLPLLRFKAHIPYPAGRKQAVVLRESILCSQTGSEV